MEQTEMTYVPEDDEQDDDRRHHQRRESDNSAMRMLGISLAAISLAGSIFTAGYNWRSVAILEQAHEEDKRSYVRKDVHDEQLNSITYKLSSMERQLDTIQAATAKR